MANSISQKHTGTNRLSNPYPGLRPFTMDESHLFFGREAQIKEVLGLLRENRFVAVTGASGSGKSSLISCGIVPSLNKEKVWKSILCRPGNAPMENLVMSILKATSSRIPGKTELAEICSSNIDILHILQESYKEDGKNLLIIIDQFEELFRFKPNVKNTQAREDQLVDFITYANQSKVPVWIVITMRSDFIGECSRFQELTSLINKSGYLIPRMDRENIQKLIIGPAGVAGVEFSADLVEHIIWDLSDDPDQLPVLQHALMRTWEYWKGHADPTRPVTINDYLAVGGVAKALSRHADEAYDELNPGEKYICEKLFKTITEKGSDNVGIRRPTDISSIIAIVQASEKEIMKIVNVFRAPGRAFLTPPASIPLEKHSIIDLSHESLMRIWDRLRVWVEEEAAAVNIYKRLAESSALFQIGKTGLWRPPELHLATNWQMKNNPNLAWAVRFDPAYERAMVFLKASEQEYLAGEENKSYIQRRKLRRNRFLAFGFGLISMIAVSLVLWTQKLNADKVQEVIAKENQIMLAEQKSHEAEEQRLAAEQALFDARQQTTRADSALYMAENRRLEAETSAVVAANQTALARENLGEANRQRVLAVQNEQEADAQKKQAEQAREEALQQRLLSTARAMAVKSLQITGDADLKALLAYQAYLFAGSSENVGLDIDFYSALYKSVKLLRGDDYNVFTGHTNAVRSVAFLPNTSSFISTGSDGKLLKWNLNLSSNSPAVLLSGRNVLENVKVSYDGKWLLATESRMGMIYLDLSAPTLTPVQLNKGGELNIRSIAIAPDNHTVYTAGLNSFIEVWNMNDLSVKKFTNTTSQINALALSPDGSILVAGARDGRTSIWRVKGEPITNSIFNDPANPVQAIEYSPDGRYLACGTLNGNVMLFRADNFELAGVISGHTARITDIVFSPDSKCIATSSYDGKVLYRELSSLTSAPIVLDDNSGFVFCIGFSPDGRYLISGSTEEKRLIASPATSGLLAGQICSLVKRNLSRQEWNTYIGSDIEYQETCSRKQTSEIETDQ